MFEMRKIEMRTAEIRRIQVRKRCLFAVFMLLAAASPQAQENPATRVALVIGNSNYVTAPLRNPKNDATLIAQTLRGLGFLVIEEIDTTQLRMKKAIAAFGEQIEASPDVQVALFYYAGHGIQVGGRNYMIPVDAQIGHERDVDLYGVATDAVLSTLEYARRSLNVVILDACRNNPFARSFRSAARGLARMDAPNGTLIAYATNPGNTANDGAGKNSPYTAALARAMQEPGVPVEKVFKNTRISVMQATDDEQVPWESSSLTGDFFFAPAKAAAVERPQQIATRPAPMAASPEPGYVLQFLRLECKNVTGRSPFGGTDEPYIAINHARPPVWTGTARCPGKQDLHSEPFEMRQDAFVELWESDAGEAYNSSDDLLGSVTVPRAEGTGSHHFRGDNGHYVLEWEVRRR